MLLARKPSSPTFSQSPALDGFYLFSMKRLSFAQSILITPSANHYPRTLFSELHNIFSSILVTTVFSPPSASTDHPPLKIVGRTAHAGQVQGTSLKSTRLILQGALWLPAGASWFRATAAGGAAAPFTGLGAATPAHSSTSTSLFALFLPALAPDRPGRAAAATSCRAQLQM